MAKFDIGITKVAHLKGHRDAVYDFDLDTNRQLVYSASADGSIVRWEPHKNVNGTMILQGSVGFYCIHLNVENQLLYAGNRLGELFVLNPDNSQLLRQESLNMGEIFCIASDEKSLYIGTAGGNLRVERGSQQEVVQLGTKNIRCILVLKDMIAIGSSDHQIYLLNKEDLSLVSILRGHQNSVFGLELINDHILASTGRDATIKFWDLTAFIQIISVPAHMYQAKSLSFKGDFLLSSSMDKTIKIWDDELSLIKVIDLERNESHTNCVNRVKWMDDRMFVSSSDDRSLIVWQVEINP